ncbi:MAG: DUF1565 domain-containing protein, partial [Lachnospirales bacterium]
MLIKEYHVSVDGCDFSCGDFNYPFKTITKAANIAKAGDTILVHKGIYREWISPVNGGISLEEMIT